MCIAGLTQLCSTSPPQSHLPHSALYPGAGKPFYIQVAPIGCHDACYVDEKFDGYLTPPLPAPRHAKLYADVNLPYRANLNEDDVSDKPAWLQAVPK